MKEPHDSSQCEGCWRCADEEFRRQAKEERKRAIELAERTRQEKTPRDREAKRKARDADREASIRSYETYLAHHAVVKIVVAGGPDECGACGDGPAQFYPQRARWYCNECAAEVISGVVPPLHQITSKHFNVPDGTTIIRRGRTPGTGEGNDYFGNHT